MLEEILVSKGEKRASILRIFLAALAMVLFWRGVWHLADLYLFPGNEVLSSLISLIAGILILLLLRVID